MSCWTEKLLWGSEARCRGWYEARGEGGNCIKLGGKSAPGHLITPLGQGKIRPVTGFIHLHGVNSYNARLYYPQVIHRKFQTLFRLEEKAQMTEKIWNSKYWKYQGRTDMNILLLSLVWQFCRGGLVLIHDSQETWDNMHNKLELLDKHIQNKRTSIVNLNLYNKDIDFTEIQRQPIVKAK